MKNVRKRFLSLIMAMMMVLSCVATASAADVADTTSAGDDSVVVLSSTNGDDGIMPLGNIHYYTPELAVNGFQNSHEGELTINTGYTLAIVIVSSVNVKVTITTRAGKSPAETRISSTNGDGKIVALNHPNTPLLNYKIEKDGGSGTFAFQIVGIQ
jgi:hypothetical protein